jgi:hypothetical protein
MGPGSTPVSIASKGKGVDMSIFKGAVSARRYRVLGELPEGWRSAFVDRLLAYAASSPSLSGQGDMVKMGASLQDNLLDTTFDDLDRWLNDSYIVFNFRVDKLEMPKGKIKARTEQRIRAWISEQGVERCPASIRRQIKEAVIAELSGENRIKMHAYEVAWNVNGGELYFGSTAEKLNDDFRKWFLRCFGLKLSARELPGRFKVTKTSVEPDICWPSSDLFLWVFHRSAVLGGGVGRPGEELSISVGDRIVFKDADTKITVKGSRAQDKQETRRALLQRREIEDLDVELYVGGDLYGSFGMKGFVPDLLKVKSAMPEPEGAASERRVAKMLDHERVVATMDGIAETFVEVREDEEAWAKIRAEVMAWAGVDSPSNDGKA